MTGFVGSCDTRARCVSLGSCSVHSEASVGAPVAEHSAARGLASPSSSDGCRGRVDDLNALLESLDLDPVRDRSRTPPAPFPWPKPAATPPANSPPAQARRLGDTPGGTRVRDSRIGAGGIRGDGTALPPAVIPVDDENSSSSSSDAPEEDDDADADGAPLHRVDGGPTDEPVDSPPTFDAGPRPNMPPIPDPYPWDYPIMGTADTEANACLRRISEVLLPAESTAVGIRAGTVPDDDTNARGTISRVFRDAEFTATAHDLAYLVSRFVPRWDSSRVRLDVLLVIHTTEDSESAGHLPNRRNAWAYDRDYGIFYQLPGVGDGKVYCRFSSDKGRTVRPADPRRYVTNGIHMCYVIGGSREWGHYPGALMTLGCEGGNSSTHRWGIAAAMLALFVVRTGSTGPPPLPGQRTKLQDCGFADKAIIDAVKGGGAAWKYKQTRDDDALSYILRNASAMKGKRVWLQMELRPRSGHHPAPRSTALIDDGLVTYPVIPSAQPGDVIVLIKAPDWKLVTLWVRGSQARPRAPVGAGPRLAPRGRHALPGDGDGGRGRGGRGGGARGGGGAGRGGGGAATGGSGSGTIFDDLGGLDGGCEVGGGGTVGLGLGGGGPVTDVPPKTLSPAHDPTAAATAAAVAAATAITSPAAMARLEERLASADSTIAGLREQLHGAETRLSDANSNLSAVRVELATLKESSTRDLKSMQERLDAAAEKLREQSAASERALADVKSAAAADAEARLVAERDRTASAQAEARAAESRAADLVDHGRHLMLLVRQSQRDLKDLQVSGAKFEQARLQTTMSAAVALTGKTISGQLETPKLVEDPLRAEASLGEPVGGGGGGGGGVAPQAGQPALGDAAKVDRSTLAAFTAFMSA